MVHVTAVAVQRVAQIPSRAHMLHGIGCGFKCHCFRLILWIVLLLRVIRSFFRLTSDRHETKRKDARGNAEILH